MNKNYIKKEVMEWIRIFTFVILGAFVLWCFSYQQTTIKKDDNPNLPEIVFYDDGLPEILPPLIEVELPPLER